MITLRPGEWPVLANFNYRLVLKSAARMCINGSRECGAAPSTETNFNYLTVENAEFPNLESQFDWELRELVESF